MENWTARFRNPKSLYEVVAVEDRSDKGVRLRVRTAARGERAAWFPRRHVRVSRWREAGGRERIEALIPDWLAESRGLVEERRPAC